MAFDQSRTERVIGKEGIEKLAGAHVAVFGAGGVGGYAIEALVRAGVGEITVIDGDIVDPSNLNRQIISLRSNIGRPKTEVVRERILSIDPGCIVHAKQMFFLPENSSEIDFSEFDAVADCIDTLAAKVEIARLCGLAGVPVISSMGAGNKLHPERFKITDIFKTEVDPLAKSMRYRLRQAGIKHLPCVWSDEIPAVKSVPPGSMSFVPPVPGMMIAGWIVRKICGIE